MYACTKAAAAWFDCFFSVPLADVPGLPFSIYVGMSQVQAILYKLTTSEDPAWDKQLLRSTANLLVLLDRTSEKLGEVGRMCSLRSDDGDDNIFAKGARIQRSVMSMWEPALSQHLSSNSLMTPSSQGSQAMVGLAGPEPRLMMDSSALLADATYDLNDLTWMTDIFGPWDL